jgi:hypothetical protein
MKISPVGAELFHADRQTGITKLTVAVHNFANVPKKIHITILPLGTCTYISASLQITLQDTIARERSVLSTTSVTSCATPCSACLRAVRHLT